MKLAGRLLRTLAIFPALIAQSCTSSTDAGPLPDTPADYFVFKELQTVPGAWFQIPTDIHPSVDTLEYSSTNPAVATVDDTGIRVLAAGSAYIVARAGVTTDSLRIEAQNVTYADIAVGSGITCGLTGVGDVYCWGGIALVIPTGTGTQVRAWSFNAPVRMAAATGLDRLAMGFGHWCGLTGGTVRCWGSNSLGRLGQGTTDDAYHTVPLTVPGVTATVVDPGGFYTCALAASGAAFCWGYNSTGSVGDGTEGNVRPSPVPVIGGLSFTTLTTGQERACALDAAGVAWCWGMSVTAPEAVDTALHFVEISTWASHVCARTAAMAIWCWDDEAPAVVTATPATLAGLVTAAHHTCGLAAGGVAWCWGDNSAGQLGIGTVEIGTVYASPVQVSGGHAFTQLWSGGNVTCGRAASARIYCWGANVYGEIGDGSGAAERPQPMLVLGQL